MGMEPEREDTPPIGVLSDYLAVSSGRPPTPMTPSKPFLPFPELVSRLLQLLGLEVPAGGAQEVYTLHFAGEPDVHLVRRTGARCIDLVTTACELSSLKSPEILAALLELNGCDGTAFTPAVMLDRATRAVLVKVRLPEYAVDVALLRAMLDGLRKQSIAVRKLMAPPAPAPRTTRRIAGTQKTFMSPYEVCKP